MVRRQNCFISLTWALHSALPTGNKNCDYVLCMTLQAESLFNNKALFSSLLPSAITSKISHVQLTTIGQRGMRGSQYGSFADSPCLLLVLTQRPLTYTHITGSQLFLTGKRGLSWARIFRKLTFEEWMIIKVCWWFWFLEAEPLYCYWIMSVQVRARIENWAPKSAHGFQLQLLAKGNKIVILCRGSYFL